MTRLEFKLMNEQDLTCMHFKCKESKEEDSTLITMDLLEPYFQKMLTVFYSNVEKFIRVLDLLIASIQNKTSEISFLNITTAFEVFHKYFLEIGNKELRKAFATELKIAGLIESDSGKWDQILRYYHLFKLLEEVEYFRDRFKNPLRAIELIKDTRNYYTHYSVSRKEIWTPNQLFYENITLRQILKAILLLQLKLPSEMITSMLNKRSDIILYHYEKNEFSQNYLYANSSNC